MDKTTRTSTSKYKKRGTKLPKVPAKKFLTRLEQKANEARNYDIETSEKKFIWTLLNNMKFHRYYKERIVSFLTIFELNTPSISQKCIETNFTQLMKRE